MSIYRKFLCLKCSTPYLVEATPDVQHTNPVVNKPADVLDIVDTNHKCKNSSCGYENKLYWVTTRDYLKL